MAKLNVVIPAVNVTVDGIEYRKVDRKAQAGDIVKVADEATPSYVINGAFYAVKEFDSSDDTVHIRDEDGDAYWLSDGEYETYEVSQAAAPSVEYREVKRKASVGERIRIVARWSSRDPYEDGAEFTVVDRAEDVIVIVEVNGYSFRVNDREYVVLEPLTVTQSPTQPKRLTVGDYAKVVDPAASFPLGTVVKIIVDDKTDVPYKAEDANGDTHWAKECRFESATEAEFLAAKAELQRKPAEPVRLKVGEFAKVIGSTHANYFGGKDGDIVELKRESSAGTFNCERIDGYDYAGNPWAYAQSLTPATPEEVAQAQADAKRKAAIGPFADGGFAQIVNANAENASPTPRANPDAFVKVTLARPSSNYALKVSLPNADYGVCNADALRQITEAEYHAEVAPKPEFNAGDKVRIVSGAGERWLIDYVNGDVCEVNFGPDGDGDYALSAPRAGVTPGNAQAHQLVKLAAEEAAAIEKEAQETAKWAAINRKVGEFKRGDIVKIESTDTDNGLVGEVGDVGTSLIGVRRFDGAYRGPRMSDAILIVPVEQRFDTEKAA